MRNFFIAFLDDLGNFKHFKPYLFFRIFYFCTFDFYTLQSAIVKQCCQNWLEKCDTYSAKIRQVIDFYLTFFFKKWHLIYLKLTPTVFFHFSHNSFDALTKTSQVFGSTSSWNRTYCKTLLYAQIPKYLKLFLLS